MPFSFGRTALILLTLFLARGNLPGIDALFAQAPPILNEGATEQQATAGYYTLTWFLPAPSGESPDTLPQFELVEATTPDFSDEQVVYRGPDLATTISGKPNGDFYYRIRVISTSSEPLSRWSGTHEVSVRHHTLQRALSFLGIGAVVFLATLALIWQGHRREKHVSLT